MFERHLTKHLKPGEVVVAIVRRSLWAEVGRLALGAAVTLAPFFLLVPLIRWGEVGAWVLVGVFLLGLVWLVRTLFVWSLNAFVLTNDRIVDLDQRGFFSTMVSSAYYDRIQDVSFSVRGLWQTIFQLGVVTLQTAGSEVRLELHGVREPQRINEQITDLVRQRAAVASQANAEQLATALQAATVPASRTARSVVKPRPAVRQPKSTDED